MQPGSNRLFWIIAVAVAGTTLSGCERPPAERDAAQDVPANATAVAAPAPALPVVEPVELGPLARSDLIAAAARAADAVASGQPLPEVNKALTDRKFALRLPFGCNGPEADGWAGWTWNPATRALKITVRPEQWGKVPWIASIAPQKTFEAVEGFWIRRPWTSSEACPAVAAAAAAKVPEAAIRQTLGLAEFFSTTSSRPLQRGARPYAVTLRQPDAPDGQARRFMLSVQGRVSSFDDGQPVHCWSPSFDLAPLCLIAVEFDTIAIEDRSTEKSVAEWRS